MKDKVNLVAIAVCLIIGGHVATAAATASANRYLAWYACRAEARMALMTYDHCDHR
jgi:hypothetical protein